MGAGRRTETYLGPHFPSAGSPASSSNSAHFLNLPPGELASVIFGCTHATYDECVKQLIFGLPQAHYSYIKHISPGMSLFLFNYSDRKLHGIYEAESHGDLNINPYAWTGGKAVKTQFPAQVRVRVKCHCNPLPEKVFKEAIAANYLKDTQNHFYFELNHVQKDMLESFFMKKATDMSPQPGPSAWRHTGDEEGWTKPKKTTKSTMEAWHKASSFIPAAALTSPAQNGGRAHTPEHWDDGSDKVEDETTAGNGTPVSQDTVNRTLERFDEKPLDRRAIVMLSNKKPSEVDEDWRNAERELELVEKLKHLKEKGKTQSNVEIRAEFPRTQGALQGEALSLNFVESTKVQGSSCVESTNIQDPARVEWERLARERCLQEQTMLREERELLREKFQALDAPVARAINKNLEICASAIAQMRQDEITLRELMDEALNQVELLRELEQLRKKNASLENTQVQMASDLERLKSEVSRMSQQLSMLPSQMPHQLGVEMQTSSQVDEAGFSNGNGNEEYFQQIYLIGGYDGQSWLGSVDILYPATYEFISVAPLLAARSYAAATVLLGSIFVFGGGSGSSWYETVETYNEDKDEWVSCPPMSLKRGSLAGATVGDRIFAVGGGNKDDHFSDVECFDAQLGMWIRSTSMLSKRFGVAAAELNGVLYAMGGYNKSAYLVSVERFDPREGLWTAVAPMTRKRGSLSSATLGGKLYAIGGFDGDQFLNSMEVYEPRTNRWTEMESRMHTGRACGAAARIGSDIYMFGGVNKGNYLETVECYGESTGWEVVDDIALGTRSFHSCVAFE